MMPAANVVCTLKLAMLHAASAETKLYIAVVSSDLP